MRTPPSYPCPVCQPQTQSGFSGRVIEQRLNIPLLQNVTLATQEAAKAALRGALQMTQCSNCGFVWNASFDPDVMTYDGDYNNDVSASSFYQAHLCSMADRILASVPPEEEIHYVEIGCGEGDFLCLLHERGQGRVVSAVGFDPSFTGQDKLPDGVVVHTSYFTPAQVAQIPAQTNVICSRHTIEHVSDVKSFAASLAAGMAPGRQLFVETPDVDWILRHGAFQDFFYEHCALYTPYSISLLLAQHGLQCEVSPAYDGQYMWVQAQIPAAGTPVVQPLSRAPEAQGQAYKAHSTALLDSWAAYLERRASAGPIVVWGAASKGVTFSLLMNARARGIIAAGIDLNQAKQGCYMPVTGIPIVAPQEAMQMGAATIVIMNPNYETEIQKMIAGMGWTAEVAVLNEASDDPRLKHVS
ncbi:C-methyltransferase-like protein [Tritonibacter scottomollicae]|uniref:C-methyltransferase-like protein n=1 Tax=Tritonibacter scottomollicae TaxID=483013 RepID=A0A2T1A2C6_TRISK|nr:C-methyltransferase-like protein [Tritonibacter scottomollicae]